MAKITLLLSIIWHLCGYVHCSASNPVRQCVTQAFASQIGVREATGRNDGKEVETFLRTCKLPKGHSWCAAFINWSLTVCKSKTHNNAWAAAWFPANKVIYRNGSPPRKIPEAGDVVGFRFSSDGRISHVGFVEKWGEKITITVEGNTNGAGSREGDGVYRKRRLTKTIAVVSDWIG